MAKKCWDERNKRKMKLVEKHAALRKELKENGEWEKLDRLPRHSSKIRVTNRCSITGRRRGFMRRFGVSRLVFRELAWKGEIPGVKKASW